jgi:hypothetical protein
VTVGGERIKYRGAGRDAAAARAAEAHDRLAAEIETQAARLRCTTLRYLNIGARGKPPADWHWIYVPGEALPVLPVNVFSTAMPSMARRMRAICEEMAEPRPIADAPCATPRRRCGGGRPST